VNLKIWNLEHRQAVNLFTASWLVSSIFLSGFFAFFLFEAIQKGEEKGLVEMHFRSENPGGDFGRGVFYLPNRGIYRQRYLQSAIETDFLFFSKCDVIVRSQRPKCDSDRNWSRIDIGELGCSDIESCAVAYSELSPQVRFMAISRMISTDGTSLTTKDEREFSFENPASWGAVAPYVMFVFSFFLSIKAGRAVGEFLFEPYKENDT
jgi:hypothetical protein